MKTLYVVLLVIGLLILAVGFQAWLETTIEPGHMFDVRNELLWRLAIASDAEGVAFGDLDERTVELAVSMALIVTPERSEDTLTVLAMASSVVRGGEPPMKRNPLQEDRPGAV